MIDRNRELAAMQDRVREKLGGWELTTPGELGKAIGLGRDETRRLLKGLPTIAGKYGVNAAVERVFDELHPRPRRAG